MSPATDKERKDQADPPPYIQDGVQSEEGLSAMLDLQLEIVWPLELPYLIQTGLSSDKKLLDIGCGHGAWANKVASHFDGIHVTAVDLEQQNIDAATRRHLPLENKNSTLAFETANAYDLSHFRDFDFASCRSMLYTVPKADEIVSQILQTLRPDFGVAHFFCEDYGMVFASPTDLDLPKFWRDGPCAALQNLDCNPYMARSIYGIARRAVEELGLQARISVATVPITTSPFNPANEGCYRVTLGQIFQTWKDYADMIASNSELTAEYVSECFDDLTKACNNPDAWVLWQCVICTVRLEGRKL